MCVGQAGLLLALIGVTEERIGATPGYDPVHRRQRTGQDRLHVVVRVAAEERIAGIEVVIDADVEQV